MVLINFYLRKLTKRNESHIKKVRKFFSALLLKLSVLSKNALFDSQEKSFFKIYRINVEKCFMFLILVFNTNTMRQKRLL